VAARFELALSRATSFITLAAHDLAALRSNRPEPVGTPAPRRIVAFAGAWPDAEAPVARSSVAALGEQVAVEARRRPRRIASGPPAPVAYAEDDAPLDQLAALVWLGSRPRGGRAVAAAAVQGVPTLRALAADACVARRVAAHEAAELLAVDDDPGTAAALARVADLLALPRSRAEITTSAP
jgi:hypothetical protein